jgi:glycosyltransferase involved in cell wall biosynthesis
MQANKIRKYEITQCPRFDCNIVVSNSDGKELESLVPGIGTAIIPNGSDTSFFKPMPAKAKSNTIIHVGRLRAANLDSLNYFLSKIWPLIKQRNENAHLKIVGGEAPHYIKELAEKEKNITVTGFVKDIRPHIWESSVVVVPLRYGGGTKLKVLNAMAAGKAVVSTSIGCEGIDVIQDENIVIADDPAMFAKKTNELLANQQKRVSLGMEARKLIESKYSWEIIGERLQAAYESTLR